MVEIHLIKILLQYISKDTQHKKILLFSPALSYIWPYLHVQKDGGGVSDTNQTSETSDMTLVRIKGRSESELGCRSVVIVC